MGSPLLVQARSSTVVVDRPSATSLSVAVDNSKRPGTKSGPPEAGSPLSSSGAVNTRWGKEALSPASGSVSGSSAKE